MFVAVGCGAGWVTGAASGVWVGVSSTFASWIASSTGFSIGEMFSSAINNTINDLGD